jgi:AcrR family transcriptional regulator
MGIKERKIREKENLKKLILESANKILMKDGLDRLTMRSIADNIEYSQSKIYEFFASKDELCEGLCKMNCNKQLTFLQKISIKQEPEKYLNDLVLKSMEFHSLHPHSDTLLTLVCFGPERFKIPEEFLKIEELFINALVNLKSPYITTKDDILASLDIIRCIFIGVSTLMNTETSAKGKIRALNMTENILSVLLRGWRKQKN